MPRSAAAVEKFFQLSLLGMVASGFLAVAGSGYLDAATTILMAAGLVLRGAMAAGLLNLEISERTITVLTIGYIGFYPLDSIPVPRLSQATVHLVFFVAIRRILTAKANRDYLHRRHRLARVVGRRAAFGPTEFLPVPRSVSALLYRHAD
jgi:hypothetical protein